MKDTRGFDEVMIVNPHDPRFDTTRGVRLMRFHYAQPPGMGHYAAPDPYGYGYYRQDPYHYGVGDPYGYYAQPPQMPPYAGSAFFGQAPYEPGYGKTQPEPVGYYADESPYAPIGEPQEPVGYVAEEYPIGCYGEDYPATGYGEDYPATGYGEDYPMGYYADEYPYGPMGEPQEPGYYGQVTPEMVGYGEYAPPEQGYLGVGYYGEPDLGRYVREIEPTFNAGCPMPTNVAGLEEQENLEGYIKPRTVNATCQQFTPEPGRTTSASELFKPLW